VISENMWRFLEVTKTGSGLCSMADFCVSVTGSSSSFTRHLVRRLHSSVPLWKQGKIYAANPCISPPLISNTLNSTVSLVTTRNFPAYRLYIIGNDLDRLLIRSDFNCLEVFTSHSFISSCS
jgi:hypothetical protein